MPRIPAIAASLLLLTCALVHAQGLGAQAAGQSRGFDPNAPKREISGSVVNAITGEPIANALVQMFGSSQRAGLTDSAGAFRFPDVPEGRAAFMARKPGFFSSEELARGGGRPRSQVKIDATTGPITLKLTPEGIVTGAITGDDGEPLENVGVRLKRQVIVNGRSRWEDRSQARSNEDGEFRVANLPPGTYYLVAQAQRPARQRPGSEVATAYPATYYPGAPDLSSAAAIEVRGGQTVQADFRLRAQPVYEVSGVVNGIPEGQRGVGLQFINRAGEGVADNYRFNPEDATFTAKLPAGTYTVRARAMEPPQRMLTASSTVTVAGNVNRIVLALQPAPMIPILVQTEFTKPQNSQNVGGGKSSTASSKDNPERYVSVQLMALESGNPSDFGGAMRIGDSTFALQNIEAGRYQVQIQPHGPWYVQSASYGQTDLLREDLVVVQGSAARAIEIVLRDDGGSVNGSVMSDNAAAPATVLIVPERRSTPPQIQYASENGFTINTLAPGDYLLFAFDSIDGLEYGNRDALEPYLSQAARVTVSNNGSAKVTLTLIKRGES